MIPGGEGNPTPENGLMVWSRTPRTAFARYSHSKVCEVTVLTDLGVQRPSGAVAKFTGSFPKMVPSSCCQHSTNTRQMSYSTLSNGLAYEKRQERFIYAWI